MNAYGNGYEQYEEYGGYCSGCGKREDFCRCEDWGGPKLAPGPKDRTVKYFSFGLRRILYMGAMTLTQANAWVRTLTFKGKVRVAQEGSVKVLRVLPVVQTRCTCPPVFWIERDDDAQEDEKAGISPVLVGGRK